MQPIHLKEEIKQEGKQLKILLPRCKFSLSTKFSINDILTTLSLMQETQFSFKMKRRYVMQHSECYLTWYEMNSKLRSTK